MRILRSLFAPSLPIFQRVLQKTVYYFLSCNMLHKLGYVPVVWATHLMYRLDRLLGSPRVQFQFSLSLLIFQHYMHVLLEGINISNGLTVLPFQELKLVETLMFPVV